MWRKQLILALVICLAPYGLWAGPLEDGLAAYKAGDYPIAIRWWRLAAEQGDAKAQYYLGAMYNAGEGVPQDQREAVRRWRLAAKQGLAEAQDVLGFMYGNDQGVPQDDREALRRQRLAAEQGEAKAQFSLGVMYYNGEGVPEDDREAVRWWRLAAEQGHAQAQFNLGVMFARRAEPPDYPEAMRWYRLAAEQGDAQAQLSLGYMYSLAHGVPQDYREAARWWRLAAEQGNARAQHLMGFNYYAGWGVPKDERETLRWWRLAAEQGDAHEQYYLGLTCERGDGVPQDDREAVRWYRLAAERGYALAQYNLGRMYYFGKGVPQDYVEGHLWWNLAAAQGDEDAAKNRDIVARLMTPAQLAEAQRLAREWRPRKQGSEGSAIVKTPTVPLERPTEPKSTGSGFVVSAAGHLLTNQHVVDSCARLTVQATGGRRPATVVRADTRNDLALLKMQDKAAAQAHFREGRGIRSGDSVVVLGYPLSGLLASEANVTTGTVSALSGPGDDSRLMQITAPVQPGNSGGPILDSAGNIVGIVVSKLDALKVAAAIGDIPQNVNFGIHASVARTFLDANGVDYQTAPAERTLDPATIAAQAKAYTVLVECW